MPRFDGTGPFGAGPGTGWGCGPCGAGGARGFISKGFCNCCPCCGRSMSQNLTKKEELDILKEEEKYLEEELKAIKSEISSFGKNK